MSNQPGHDHGHPHTHDHDHDHSHDHTHAHAEPDPTTLAALDAAATDSDLSPAELTRRNLLRAAGVAGGAAAAAGAVGMLGVTPAMAEPGGGRPTDAPPQRPGATGWLAGDHHIHTQYSSDAQYTVLDQAQHGAAYGLDWLVITDHGGATHARIGVDLVNPDIRDARSKLPDTLIFQGLEWNIPSAEHGTVFVTPGRNEVAVLKQFENDYDGSVNNASSSSPANERLAVAGVQWLGQQMDRKRVQEALFLANHPARNGIDSPHEIRAWRDADPRVAVGFEGAPGHQAAGLPEGYGPASNRGYYGNSPGPNSFPDYPAESYRTWGGFDWFTATVGGLWDSLLAEGKPWTISANSDSHVNWSDTSRRPDGSSAEQFNRDGRYGDPVYAGTINLGAGDFWPGFYSRTHVGAAKRGYAAVMQGIRAGAVWVDHGQLVDQVEVLVRPKGRKGQGVTLGGTLQVKRGTPVEMVVRITPAQRPNWAQFTPSLNRVDLVRGAVDPRPARADRDVFTAPDTRVVSRWDTSGRTQRFELTRDLGRVEDPFYVRLRGTDGNVSQEGYLGADVDAQGPRIDPAGDADPWTDLWFYTNPVWVVPTR